MFLETILEILSNGPNLRVIFGLVKELGLRSILVQICKKKPFCLIYSNSFGFIILHLAVLTKI